MEKDKKHSSSGVHLDEETSLKIRQALQTVDISSLAHISEVDCNSYYVILLGGYVDFLSAYKKTFSTEIIRLFKYPVALLHSSYIALLGPCPL